MNKFFPGQIITLVWPERSSWDDTEGAVDDGTLEVGVQYEVKEFVETYKNLGPSVFVFCGEDECWGLSAQCFREWENQKIKRALPEWW